MLWNYTLILLIVALISTILSFHKNIERVGQIFFLFIGGVMWPAFAISLLEINFKWAGSTTVVSYTYIPSSESPLIYGFGVIGVLMLVIGVIRAVDMVFNPIVDMTSGISQESMYDKRGMHKL